MSELLRDRLRPLGGKAWEDRADMAELDRGPMSTGEEPAEWRLFSI